MESFATVEEAVDEAEAYAAAMREDLARMEHGRLLDEAEWQAQMQHIEDAEEEPA